MTLINFVKSTLTEWFTSQISYWRTLKLTNHKLTMSSLLEAHLVFQRSKEGFVSSLGQKRSTNKIIQMNQLLRALQSMPETFCFMVINTWKWISTSLRSQMRKAKMKAFQSSGAGAKVCQRCALHLEFKNQAQKFWTLIQPWSKSVFHSTLALKVVMEKITELWTSFSTRITNTQLKRS